MEEEKGVIKYKNAVKPETVKTEEEKLIESAKAKLISNAFFGFAELAERVGYPKHKIKSLNMKKGLEIINLLQLVHINDALYALIRSQDSINSNLDKLIQS